jgi:hypothetical protein
LSCDCDGPAISLSGFKFKKIKKRLHLIFIGKQKKKKQEYFFPKVPSLAISLAVVCPLSR